MTSDAQRVAQRVAEVVGFDVLPDLAQGLATHEALFAAAPESMVEAFLRDVVGPWLADDLREAGLDVPAAPVDVAKRWLAWVVEATPGLLPGQRCVICDRTEG